MLVGLLNSSATQNDRLRLELWQRLSFITEPTEQTVQAAQQHFSTVQGDERLAMLQTLGALAGRVKPGENPAMSDAIQGVLRDQYAAASTESERVAGLAGLGNARKESDIPTFLAALSSQEPSVRGAAIRAIGRQYESTVARAALVTVISHSDQEAKVVTTAVRSLAKSAMSDAELGTLKTLATEVEKLDSDVAQELSKTLSRQMDLQPVGSAWRSAVESLASKATGPAAVQSQGLLYLDQLQKSAGQ